MPSIIIIDGEPHKYLKPKRIKNKITNPPKKQPGVIYSNPTGKNGV